MPNVYLKVRAILSVGKFLVLLLFVEDLLFRFYGYCRYVFVSLLFLSGVLLTFMLFLLSSGALFFLA